MLYVGEDILDNTSNNGTVVQTTNAIFATLFIMIHRMNINIIIHICIIILFLCIHICDIIGSCLKSYSINLYQNMYDTCLHFSNAKFAHFNQLNLHLSD